MSGKTYKNNIESLKEHKLPEWFDNSKFGIFIHWGLYSVPAWAPIVGDVDKMIKEEGWEKMFETNSYAEWYLNTMKIEGSPTQKYHYKKYGKDFKYEQFAPMFNKAIKKWQPDKWAELFKRSGARYIVLVTKHCDSFLPWPSKYPHPTYKENYIASRDIVGELTDAVRERDMIMGLYYCGGMDWTFNTKVVRTFYDVYTTIPQSKEYNEYINYHWRELIDKYKPNLLWGDIGWPDDSDPLDLFAYYYNNVPDGVINDRFAQLKNISLKESDFIIPPPSIYYDFRTPEYNTFEDKRNYKWELCRGIGSSFGYNQNETDKDYMSVDNLVHLLSDIVSKNGNLLLNVGPKADGTIPRLQEERLIGIGKWLEINGEAIYGTSPWVTAEGKTVEGIDVRFTQKSDTLYAILTRRKRDTGAVTIKSLKVKNNTKINLLGNNSELKFQQADRGLKILLPDNIEASSAYVLKITPRPDLV